VEGCWVVVLVVPVVVDLDDRTKQAISAFLEAAALWTSYMPFILDLFSLIVIADNYFKTEPKFWAV
jgi:hypothetical protein